MRAILSDIHGNLEALQAVLQDLAQRGATEIICLGDLVGYGPNPLECLALSMEWNIVVQGNFDYAVLSDDDLMGWSALAAKQSVLWCRDLFNNSVDGSRLRTWLAERPRVHDENGTVFVHGTPRNPLYEYLWPEDIYTPRKLTAIGARFDRYCFNGHTHVPGVFVDDASGSWRYISPEECEFIHRLDGQKTICNVGSVGQPRDGDRRACYVLVDDENIRFRRVEYDLQTTIQKFYLNPHLDNFLGDRLKEGR